MQSTKQQILALLKRAGSATVEETAGSLSLASMTVRQHLVNLERDGLVRSYKVRRPTGRPHFAFTLTDKGEEMFPKRYDILAQILLDEAGSLEPEEIAGRTAEERRFLLVRRAADRLVEEYRPRVEGRRLEERAAAVTDLLQTLGGFAEWCPTDDGLEIRDYNCVFSRILPQHAGDCQWHLRLLTSLLERPVRHEETVLDGAVRCCRYVVLRDAEG
jgi:predicted ArsR family transcriptional regulator